VEVRKIWSIEMEAIGGDSRISAEADGQASNVIPFPQRLPSGRSAASGSDPADMASDPQYRLEQAVLRLNQAIDEQRRAVDLWRLKLVALQSSVLSLADNLRVVDETVSAAAQDHPGN
jgi:hypothetical protein